MPQFVPGRNSVLADALSRPDQVIGSEWILHQEVFDWLCKHWPVTIYLFASSLSRRHSVYFAPVLDPIAAGTDAMFQSWDSLQAYAPPPPLPTACHDQSIPVEGVGLPEPVIDSDRSLLATLSVVSQATGAVVRASSSSSILVGPPAAAASHEVSPKPVSASSCVKRLQQIARASGFSRCVACRLGQAMRASSIANYQSKWLLYHHWCAVKGHSVSTPSVAKVVDYQVWLWEVQGLSLFGEGASLYVICGVSF